MVSRRKNVKLTIWVSRVFKILYYVAINLVQDTSGLERFRTITSSYCRAAQGVILGTFDNVVLDAFLLCIAVYDISDRTTFQALPGWYSGLRVNTSDSVVKIIVGNKSDKVRHSIQL